jgi:hypothetical protein
MNKDPHGHHPILVDLFKFTQEVPDNVKKQRPETDDWLYFPPQVVPTTCEIIDGKKKLNQPILHGISIVPVVSTMGLVSCQMV